MPKGLCITALTIAVIALVLFLADLVLGLAGMANLAPFKFNNLVMDAIFITCGLTLAIMSWTTLQKQV